MAVISLKISDKQARKIKKFAERQGYNSQSEFIRDAIRRRMETRLTQETIQAITEGRKNIQEGKAYTPKELRQKLELE